MTKMIATRNVGDPTVMHHSDIEVDATTVTVTGTDTIEVDAHRLSCTDATLTTGQIHTQGAEMGVYITNEGTGFWAREFVQVNKGATSHQYYELSLPAQDGVMCVILNKDTDPTYYAQVNPTGDKYGYSYLRLYAGEYAYMFYSGGRWHILSTNSTLVP